METDWLTLYNQAVAALGRGGTKNQVDPIVADVSKGRFSSFDSFNEFMQPFLGIEDPERQRFAVNSAIEAQEEAEKAADLQELGKPNIPGIAGGALRTGRNVLEVASQILSLGFADQAIEQVPGLEEFGQRQRERQALREEHLPGTTLATEAAAGLAGSLPFSALTRGRAAIRGGGAAKGALFGGLRAGAVGGGAGALATVGFSEEGSPERAPSNIIKNAGISALTAGAFGAASGGLAGALSRKFRNRRVGRRLAKETGLPNMGREEVRKADILEIRESVQKNVYQELQAAHEEVTDEGIMRVLDGIQDNERVSDVLPDDVRRVGPREITSIGFGRAATGARRVGGRRRRPPSFEELQAIRRQLREVSRSPRVRLDRPTTANSARRFADALDEAMGAAFGPELRKADDVWRAAGRNERALDLGWDLWDGKLDDVQRALREVQTAALRTGDEKAAADAVRFFNRGRLANWQAELGRGDAARRKFFDLMEQDDRRRALATMFPGGEEGEAFQTFTRAMRREGWQEATRNLVDRLIISGGVAVSSGVIGGAIGSRLGGGDRTGR